MKTIWVSDDAAKVVLANLGIICSDVVIDVNEIDLKASRENRARDIPLDESRIDGIKNAAGKGVPMPKIAVRKVTTQNLILKGKPYVIGGGNHRYDALGQYEKKLPVHVFECTDAEFEIACRVLNTVVGNGMSKDERVRAAMDSHERLGLSQESVCAIYGVTLPSLKYAISVANMDRRLQALDPKLKSAMTPSHIRKLGDLAKNDNVLRVAATLTKEKGLTTKELDELCMIARNQNTEAQQIAVFEREMARQDASKILVPKKIRAKFVSALNSIEQLKDKKTWESLEISKKEIETFRSQICNVRNILNFLLEENGEP